MLTHILGVAAAEVFPRFETIGEIQKKNNNLPQLENFTCTSKSNAQVAITLSSYFVNTIYD